MVYLHLNVVKTASYEGKRTALSTHKCTCAYVCQDPQDNGIESLDRIFNTNIIYSVIYFTIDNIPHKNTELSTSTTVTHKHFDAQSHFTSLNVTNLSIRRSAPSVLIYPQDTAPGAVINLASITRQPCIIRTSSGYVAASHVAMATA